MSVFIRRFLTDPGTEVFLEIESVNILDLDPPASISGIGTGTVACVGEYENGPFAAPTEVTGTTDYVNTFGELGYQYGGVKGNNASARARKADGTLTEELWNGSGFVQLNGKKFKRLVIVRVDTSVGTVEFRRQAYVTGAAAFSYNMEPADILSVDIGAGPVSATFTATAAVLNSAAGVYPTTFVGGEQLTLGYDAVTNFTVTFLPGDQSHAQVVARINAVAGFAFASVQAGDVTRLTGRKRGNQAQARVVSGSVLALTATGLTAPTTAVGTGNVGDIDAVKFAEIKTIVELAVAGTTVEVDQGGAIRIAKSYVADGDYIAIGTATTALSLGFTAGQTASNDGKARSLSGAGTYATLFVGGETITIGVDDEPNFTVTFLVGDQTIAQVVSRINTAAGYTMVLAATATELLFVGRANGGQVRFITSSAPAVFTTLGLTIKTVQAAGVSNGTIPAGTVVTNAANTNQFVTMQDIPVKIETIGAYTVKARHALDDGTGVSALAGTITKTVLAPVVASFQCINPVTLTAALTESQIDAQYVAAFDTTTNLNSVAKEVNVIYSARQSNTIRRKVRANAKDASAIGCFGRMGIVRPPLGTTRDQARSPIAEPGVGAYRDQRVIYTWPQAKTFVPIVGRRGLPGGKGFTADGLLDVGADGFMASILSQLAPEENPGQQTAFTDGVVGLESGPAAADMTIGDYTALKASGIAALRIDDGTAIFQSGVTSVDPAVNPQLKNISRRRMADFIQDTLARRLKTFGKKLNTLARRRAITTEIRSFMEGLLSRNQPAFQRINGYSIDDKTGNTPEKLAQGIYRVINRVRTLSSLDAIVIESVVGETVEVTETLPQS